MLAEVLLVLSGHQSSLFVPYPASPSTATTLVVSPHLTEYLHPGEVVTLNQLADLAFKYRRIKEWAIKTQKLGREAILNESLESTSSKRKGKQREEVSPKDDIPNQYFTTLADSILNVLEEYEILIVELEAKILSFDSGLLIQDNKNDSGGSGSGSGQGYVPLSNLSANFDKWRIPLGSLSSLISELSISKPSSSSANGCKEGEYLKPGKLIDLIESKRQTGNPTLFKIYTTIQNSLTQLFLTHLITFILYGIVPTPKSKSNYIPSIAFDIGSDPLSSPKYRIYQLNQNLLPVSIDGKTKESILYIGRVASTLKRENRNLPKSLIDGIREEIMNVKELDELNGLGDAIEGARAEVGEWLWKHILTGPQIIESLESLSNYFLTRKSDLTYSFLREIHQLKLDKIILSNPNSSSAVIKEQDLNLALLRSSLNTSSENDKFLDSLKFKMEKGPLRSLPTPQFKDKQTKDEADQNNQYSHSHTYKLFSSFLLGTPMNLITSITWPVDLFLSPKSLSIYSDINCYLLALRDTHLRISQTWALLSSQQKLRNKRVGRDDKENSGLIRSTWSLIRMMNWFINELLNHFMDIIDVQHNHLLKQLNIESKNGKDNSGLSGSIRGGGGSLKGSILGRNSVTPSSMYPSSVYKGLDRERGDSIGFTSSNKDGIPIPNSPLSESHTNTNWEERTVKSNKAPPTPNKSEKTYLDFLTLRSIHSKHLTFLLEALLLSDSTVSSLIKDILETCKKFTGLIEKWNGDLIPVMKNPNEDVDIMNIGGGIKERSETIKEINETLHESLLDFFNILLDSQNPPSLSNHQEGDKSSSENTLGGAKSFSRASKLNQISKMMNRQSSFSLNNNTSMKMKMESGSGLGPGNKTTINRSFDNDQSIGVGLERHIEQLLLKLDFNGILTQWKEKELNDEEDISEFNNTKSILAQGGL
ncbi:uncharacterized protein L201_007908 [Kwoniella dendrophila CBS 6074]|uniref:Spindle pole body component n=1 Tax=Kwoniella dendrophila CBS 6074 TaxID=1295534 RepID=A0AAX4K7W8_9TREE